MSTTIKEYPLYEKLLEKVKSSENQDIDIKLLCNTINNLSNTLKNNDYLEHYNEICAMIIHHGILSNTTNNILLPYGSKIMFGGKGILFTITKLDPILQHILAQYIYDN